MEFKQIKWNIIKMYEIKAFFGMDEIYVCVCSGMDNEIRIEKSYSRIQKVGYSQFNGTFHRYSQ